MKPFPHGERPKDHLAPDGRVDYGYRLVREGGRVKFDAMWFQDNRLLKYVGGWVALVSASYWNAHPEVWTDYPGGILLFTL